MLILFKFLLEPVQRDGLLVGGYRIKERGFGKPVIRKASRQ